MREKEAKVAQTTFPTFSCNTKPLHVISSQNFATSFLLMSMSPFFLITQPEVLD
jgi:hypothetical protein